MAACIYSLCALQRSNLDKAGRKARMPLSAPCKHNAQFPKAVESIYAVDTLSHKLSRPHKQPLRFILTVLVK